MFDIKKIENFIGNAGIGHIALSGRIESELPDARIGTVATVLGWVITLINRFKSIVLANGACTYVLYELLCILQTKIIK